MRRWWRRKTQKQRMPYLGALVIVVMVVLFSGLKYTGVT
jgi:flagellar biosynthesis/type III secretory pathway M-ring protein FliF/YscJ